MFDKQGNTFVMSYILPLLHISGINSAVMWSQFPLDSPSTSSRTAQVLQGQGHIKPRFRFLFQKALGKKNKPTFSLQEGLFGHFASKIPAPASPLWHKALWELSAKCKNFKIRPEPNGRPLKLHSPGFCGYLEADHCNPGRLSRRQSWWDWQNLCLNCLFEQAEGQDHDILGKGVKKKEKDSWRYITCLIETISFTGKQLHLSVLLIRTKCCNYDSIHNVL